MKYGHLDVALSVGVQLMVKPDKHGVFKPLPATAVGTLRVDSTDADQASFCLDDDEILQLGRRASQIENHYGRPMDMEWAKDVVSGELFIVPARAETVQACKSGTLMSTHRLTETGRLLAEGAAVADSIASGTACVINSAADAGNFVDGSVLVAEQTDPDWVPVMKRAKAIVTDKGGATSHVAIVSREPGITAVVGTTNATQVLVGGQASTVSCAEGDACHVHEGLLASAQGDVDLGDLPETRTAVMLSLASPSAAFKWWRLPAQGIGLARMEFVINDMVQAHSMAFAYPADYFVQTLALGLAKLAAPFHPSPVVVGISDVKSNEYAHLIGALTLSGRRPIR